MTEEQVHFPSMSEASSWLSEYKSRIGAESIGPGVYISGYYVARREQLNISLFSVCSAEGEFLDADLKHGSSISLQNHIMRCAAVSVDVANQTVDAWKKHWREADDHRYRMENRIQMNSGVLKKEQVQ